MLFAILQIIKFKKQAFKMNLKLAKESGSLVPFGTTRLDFGP